MNAAFDASEVVAELHDFQRATVDHAFRRLFTDADSTRRFLVADETGLGKTLVARGVIARTIERLQNRSDIRRIDIIYVCSNADIAEQNLRKLTVTERHHAVPATRLTLLITQPDLLRSTWTEGSKPVTFVSFTPGTSFDLGWQTGKAEERCVLLLLLTDHLELAGAAETALARILQGGVSTLDRFWVYAGQLADHLDDGDNGYRWEPGIRREFLSGFDRSPLRKDLVALVEEVRGRRRLTEEQSAKATELIAALRRLLAQSSVHALEPDLVILDEFQRFTQLLEPGTEAADLADQLFRQPDARVLLLSATPYKPFTYAEESTVGDDHYRDFHRTLRFVDSTSDATARIQSNLSAFRNAALTGGSVTELRNALEADLLKLLSRTERPVVIGDGLLAETTTRADDIEPDDLLGYVALERLARAVDAPLTIEYWKSAPYFANFLDGYKVAERIHDALNDATRVDALRPLLRATQRLHKRDIQSFKPINWSNARLRKLAADTVERGWWKLLWVPPSMRYHAAGGPYADPMLEHLTKRLIFSSWVAAPTAIASLLSYEVERQLNAAGDSEAANTASARESFSSRLRYRRTPDGRAGSMTTLALQWPSPALAAATDPLDAARERPDGELSIAEVDEWATARVRTLLGESGASTATAAAPWYSAAPLLADHDSRAAAFIFDTDEATLADLLQGSSDDLDSDTVDSSDVVIAHVREARRALAGNQPEGERPSDLVEIVAMLGVAGPGNVAWRALNRLRVEEDATTDAGLWRAAVVLASGLRALFSRRETTSLLDSLGQSDDLSYWQAVLRYCRDGNLQAVIDEYVHHLAEAEGLGSDTDDGLMSIAQAARRALTIRPARYVATDPDHPDREGISFLSRFALRYGGKRQVVDDARLPEVRAAFNSPFWPFVLASTSIGQEGVDFHWWCHAIVHWNLPANPVDFEQREGRINRYKGHAIRRNVAHACRERALISADRDIWNALFECAASERDEQLGDLKPYWTYPGDANIERYILSYPLSRDEADWARLRELLALYRLAYGQPRQDDMVELLVKRGTASDAARLEELRLILRPPELLPVALGIDVV